MENNEPSVLLIKKENVLSVEERYIREGIFIMLSNDFDKLKKLQNHYLTKIEVDIFTYVKISLIYDFPILPEIYTVFLTIFNKYENH